MIDHSLVTGFTMLIRRSFDMTCFGISTYHRHEPPLTGKSAEGGGQIVRHRRQCGVGGLSGTTFPTGKSPLYGETFRAMLVACKQHGMGVRVQGRRFSHQPSGFEPGAAHRALAAGRCCGGRHGADAQNGTAVSRARPQPRAQPVGGTAPAGRRTRADPKVPTAEQSFLINF